MKVFAIMMIEDALTINGFGIWMPIAQTFSTNIKRLRKALKISQRQLCADVKISVPTYIRWEKGENTPREAAEIDRLANYLGVAPEVLFERYEDGRKSETLPVRELTDREIIERANKLAAEGKLVLKITNNRK